jgi:SAM-dependent methyltransferase
MLGLVQRVVDAGLSPRDRWAKHLDSEANYWLRVIQSPDRLHEMFAWCLDPNLEVAQDELREAIEAVPRQQVRVLDVGAGPVTVIGRTYAGKAIDVTPIDPLADIYNDGLDKANVHPPVVTRKLSVEELTGAFPPASFDIAFCHNAIDHMPDPMLAIDVMLTLVSPDGFVVLRSLPNEGERNSYFGIHQWNVDCHGSELVIWNRTARHMLSEELSGRAEIVSARMIGAWVTAVIRPAPGPPVDKPHGQYG